MFRRIRRLFWIAFLLLTLPGFVRVGWHILRSPEGRTGAFVMLCLTASVFVTTFLVRPTRIVYRYDHLTRPDWP